MSDALAWLALRLDGVPDQLSARMRAAVASVAVGLSVHDTLAQAAERCLLRALGEAEREGALDLLAADALLTHACEAAAEGGSATLAEFTGAWGVRRFERLLTPSDQ